MLNNTVKIASMFRDATVAFIYETKLNLSDHYQTTIVHSCNFLPVQC